MIEQVTVSVNKESFTAFFVGIQDSKLHSFLDGTQPLDRLPAFEQLLADEGFTLLSENTELGIYAYSRNGTPLPEFFWMLGDTS